MKTKMNIGISEEGRKKVASGLACFLADSYSLYLKTHAFHWNVTGPMFTILHNLFEEQYEELASAVDEIAERIRILGFPAPGSFKQFGKLSSISEEEGVPKDTEMIQQLLEGQETVIKTARKILPDAEHAEDEGSVDFLIARIQVHEKNAWMLRSLLEK